MPRIQHEGLPSWVHLWSKPIDDGPVPPEVYQVLDDGERARAARYRFERDRTWFVARRAFLRTVLARYVETPPADIRYRTSRFGKPELDRSCDFSFNSSHAPGVVIVAIALGAQVGVDIEPVRPIVDALGLADAFYSPREAERVRSLDGSARDRAFLEIWTRKESYVKATGQGMSMSFGAFDVMTEGGILRSGRPRGPRGDRRFTIATLDGMAGYVGAVTWSMPGSARAGTSSAVAA